MSLNKFTVFYAGRLVTSEEKYFGLRGGIDPEIYNGCYIYVKDKRNDGWYRGDLTPVLDEDVPNTLKALLLILD